MTCLSRPFLKRLLVTIVLMASFSTVAGETPDHQCGDCGRHGWVIGHR